MQQTKRKRLETNGWKVGTAADFLELTPEEETFIEMKISLSQSLKKMRKHKHMSQVDFAKLIRSNLLIKSLLALGASQNDLAKAISSKPKTF